MTDSVSLSFGEDITGQTMEDRSPRSRPRSFISEETDLSGSDQKENTENLQASGQYDVPNPSKRLKGDSGLDFPEEAMVDAVLEPGQDPVGRYIIENTTLVSLESEAERSASQNGAGNSVPLDDDVHSEISSTTGTSSVANLRHWLDDFGKQQKKHAEESVSHQKKNVQSTASVGSAHHVHFPSGVSTGITLQKHFSSAASTGTSLQKHFSSAASTGSAPYHKKQVPSSTAVGTTPKKHSSSSGSVGLVPLDAKLKHSSSLAFTPEAKPKNFSSSASMASATTEARVQRTKKEGPPIPPSSRPRSDTKAPRIQATPVRIIKPRHDDVAATNEGRQPVSKLAAWLADDPTKSKKQVTSLRRGANIITKSRVFDKGLANIIIEQHSICSGTVERERRRWDEDSVEYGGSLALETASCVSVLNKKEWLANAFSKKGEDSVVERARTELLTDRDKREDVTMRAKQMWRQRSATPVDDRLQEDPSTRAKELWRERSASCSRAPRQDCSKTLAKAISTNDQQAQAKEMWRGRSPVCVPSQDRNISTPAIPPKPTPTPNNDQPAQATQMIRGESPASVPHQDENKDTLNMPTQATPSKDQPAPSEEVEKEIDFRQARKLLIQRSKQNGHDCEVLNKLTMKKAKFEKIARENIERQAPNSDSRKGRLKTHWGDAGKGRPSDTYARSYVKFPGPRKSLDQLP